MRVNGPKLSKSCINALIADGEISAQEVAREREKITAAKAKPKVAEAKKADADAKRRDGESRLRDDAAARREADQRRRSTDAKTRNAETRSRERNAISQATRQPDDAEPHVTARIAVEPESSQATFSTSSAREAVATDAPADRAVISAATLAALLSREPRFLPDEPSDEMAATTDAAPASNSGDSGVSASTATRYETSTPRAPAAAVQRAPVRSDVRVAQNSGAVPQAGPSRPGVDYRTGRMSLGRKLADADAVEPPAVGWWEGLMRMFSGSDQ